MREEHEFRAKIYTQEVPNLIHNSVTTFTKSILMERQC